MAEWIANNYAEELNVPLRPGLSQPWSTATLNRILQTCLVSDRKGINMHTFQTVEFESDRVVPMVLALTRRGAAMFTRSTPSCGTLDGPSLAWAASLWPKLRSSDGSPGLRLPSADGQLSRLASYLRMVYALAWYKHGIYREYTLYIPGLPQA